MLTCEYCNRLFSNPGGLGAHSPFCKENPNRVQRHKSPNAHRPKGLPAWNKGVTGLHTAWNKGVKGSTLGKGLTPEKEVDRKRKISEKAKISNGGLRQGSGRGKKGWYKNIFCDSSWELAFVLYHLDHNILIERCKEVRTYIWESKERKYYPDFVINGVIYEIKGYKTPQWNIKQQSNPDIVCLFEKDIKKYLEYAINRYGKGFTSLYEK